MNMCLVVYTLGSKVCALNDKKTPNFTFLGVKLGVDFVNH